MLTAEAVRLTRRPSTLDPSRLGRHTTLDFVIKYVISIFDRPRRALSTHNTAHGHTRLPSKHSSIRIAAVRIIDIIVKLLRLLALVPIFVVVVVVVVVVKHRSAVDNVNFNLRDEVRSDIC